MAKNEFPLRLSTAQMMEGITAKRLGCDSQGMCFLRILGSTLSTTARKLSSSVACAQWNLNREMCCNTSQSAQKRRYCVPVGNNCSAEKNQNVRKRIAIMLTCTAPLGYTSTISHLIIVVYLPLCFGGEIHHVYQFPGRDCKSAFDIKSQY